ncbi:putative enzyme related to lactoylglutathione lyase [Sphingopyxis panaciterrae]|uniref:VOC family protein n=1 Tax=Sphingopyxis panaciterrae TaxID=363841 RepID=UPI001423215E|nr:VOC family protein [Sphingopyxis panaciterrae]NIJ37248.1 putative enzyme related to lactoylglutathione lyase [Sphingopyxis panaciterrae]
MAVARIIPNRYTGDPQTGKDFFNQVLGLETAMAMAMDFISLYRSATQPMAQISIISDDPSGLRPAYSVGVDDVDAVHARAIEAGHEIVYALRDEPWGVRRFFVRDPLGDIANVVQNKD